MTIPVFAAEIFVLSRAHVPLGTLQVPTDDFLNWTTYPVPLPLHDTSTPPDEAVLATADTADAVSALPTVSVAWGVAAAPCVVAEIAVDGVEELTEFLAVAVKEYNVLAYVRCGERNRRGRGRHGDARDARRTRSRRGGCPADGDGVGT